MAEDDGGSGNPILALLKRNKAVYWLIAFLALTGGAIKWGEDIAGAGEKVVNLIAGRKDDRTRQANINFDAAVLGDQIALLATAEPYLNEAANRGVQFDRERLQKALAESHNVVVARLEALQVSQKFADRDYKEPEFGEMSAATVDLSYAINGAKNEEAARYFLFQYWLSRILEELDAPKVFGVTKPRWDKLIAHLNETLPPGVEPFRPAAYSWQELCPYWTRYFPIGALARFAGKRDQAVASCNAN